MTSTIEVERQRALFESAVIERMKESGFLDVEIRVECLARCGDGYQDEVINAGWHYWNAALNAPAPEDFTEKCPICAEPFKLGDLCSTDITEGQCHAECLAGSPAVDLANGEEVDGAPAVFPYEPDPDSTQGRTLASFPTTLPDDLREILSLMLWQTGPLAHALRAGGADIPQKAEAEQAHVLHWLILLFLADGKAWRDSATARLERIRDASGSAQQEAPAND